jgi:leader peptidase (prepilin peptidase) / N-methyltransferase
MGSFVNALVWRLHVQNEKPKKKTTNKYSILHGRSMCVHCRHPLSVSDLLPVISWVGLRGKCRYCKKPISWQYPIVELSTALLFVGSYLFWSDVISGLEIAHFIIWLASLVGLVALVIYDLRWMLLPNKIIFILYGFAVLAILTRVLNERSVDPVLGAIFGILVGGGIFYVLFQVSEGRWIGGGDVKLGFLLGALVGSPLQALLVLFMASLLGCIVVLPFLSLGMANRGTRIPFGPFLITAGIIVMVFGERITEWYISSLTSGL